MNYTFGERILYVYPLPLFTTALLVVLLLATGLGRWLSRHRAPIAAGDEAGARQEGYVVSAVLTLLALLIGFTFSLALSRFDLRRSLVIDEANAISSAYLQAGTFAEPHRTQLRAILARYVDNRLAAATVVDPDRASPLVRQGEAIQSEFWAATLAAVATIRDDVSSVFMQTGTEILDIAEVRSATRLAHIPLRVHAALLIYMIVTAAVLGFVFAGSRQGAIGVLLLLIAMSEVVIVDLDRPTSGGIIETQHTMAKLKAQLRERGEYGLTPR